jgi:hypothetical protein
MKTISIGLIMFVVGIGLSFVWWQSHPEIIEVPEPYPVTEYQTITQLKYVDRWHEPEIITVTNTIVKEIEKPVEVEKVVYRNRLPQEWESVEQFEDWYYSQGFTILFNPSPRNDCDDYAEWVNREALKQSYHISDALTWNGMYYNKKVTNNYKPREPGHAGNLVLIQGTYYYFEPKIDEFNGLIKVTDRD